MTDRTSCDRQLRAIGQSLEAQRIDVFELSRDGGRYLVKGDPEKETSLLATLRNWQQRNRRAGLSNSLSFSEQDLDNLDRQGRANRSSSNRLPDFHSLASTLRTVGAYIEAKDSELIGLHKKQLSITILSRNKSGYTELEERSLGSFYQVFLRLHANRGSIAEPAAKL